MEDYSDYIHSCCIIVPNEVMGIIIEDIRDREYFEDSEADYWINVQKDNY